MRRKQWIGILGAVVSLLCACSAKDAESMDRNIVVEVVEPIQADGEAETAPMEAWADGEAKTAPAEEREDGEAETASKDDLTDEEKQMPVLEDVSAMYREIYKQIITQVESDTISFSLIYLDEDEIPELAVCDRGYDTYSIYTVKEGAAFCMADAITAVELEYFERSGIISMFARWNGGGDEGGYGWYYYQVSTDKTIADGDLPVLYDTYDAVYDEEGNWTGAGITKYYYMDQEIDEGAYRQKLEELGIQEGKGIPVSGVEKKEILEQ